MVVCDGTDCFSINKSAGQTQRRHWGSATGNSSISLMFFYDKIRGTSKGSTVAVSWLAVSAQPALWECAYACEIVRFKTKIKWSKVEDLIGFSMWIRKWATSHLSARRVLWEVIENGGIFQEERLGMGTVSTRRERIILGPGHLFFGGKGRGGFVSCRLPLLSKGKDYLTGWCLSRKVHTCWLSLCFWERLKLQLD